MTVEELERRLMALGFELRHPNSNGSPRYQHPGCPGSKGNQRDGSTYVETKRRVVGLSATGRHAKWFCDVGRTPATLDRPGRYPRWEGQALEQQLRSLKSALG